MGVYIYIYMYTCIYACVCVLYVNINLERAFVGPGAIAALGRRNFPPDYYY